MEPKLHLLVCLGPHQKMPPFPNRLGHSGMVLMLLVLHVLSFYLIMLGLLYALLDTASAYSKKTFGQPELLTLNGREESVRLKAV